MQTLSILESQQVSAGNMSEFTTTIGGAIIGAATAVKFLGDINILWLGIVPVPVALGGAFLGSAVAWLIYDLDQYIVNSTPRLTDE